LNFRTALTNFAGTRIANGFPGWGVKPREPKNKPRINSDEHGIRRNEDNGGDEETNYTMGCPFSDRVSWSISALAFVIVSVVGLSCERKTTHVASPSPMNWTNLDTSLPTIITGDWEHAEAAWMDLRLKRTKLTDLELKLWIQLQPDILQGTRTDPLKEEIRIMAVQELAETPEFGIAYRDWLKAGLATNFFTEPKVQEKAREVLQQLEQYRQ
jgi:hypothetical protein